MRHSDASGPSGPLGTVGSTEYPPDPGAFAMESQEYLPFVVGGVDCAVPFAALVEVLSGVPATVTLPESSPWLVGVFAHRLRMYGLADPLPMLCGRPDAPARRFPKRTPPHRLLGAPASTDDAHEPTVDIHAGTVIVGSPERRLALILDALGPSFALPESAILPRSGVRTLTDVPFQPRYVVGLASRPGERSSLLVLKLEALVEDMLAAIHPRERSGATSQRSTTL